MSDIVHLIDLRELRGYQIREARVFLRKNPDGVTPQELSVETGRPLDVSEPIFRHLEQDSEVTKRGARWHLTSN